MEKRKHEFSIGERVPNEKTLSAPQELPRVSSVPRTPKMQKTTIIGGTDSSLLLTFLLRQLASTLAAAFCKALNPDVSQFSVRYEYVLFDAPDQGQTLDVYRSDF